MVDMNELMKQAQDLQDKVAAAQDALGEMIIKGIAGNALVVIEMDGKYNLRKLTLAPDLFKASPDDISALISAAYNDAKDKIDMTIERVMGEATRGLPMPQ